MKREVNIFKEIVNQIIRIVNKIITRTNDIQANTYDENTEDFVLYYNAWALAIIFIPDVSVTLEKMFQNYLNPCLSIERL